MDLKSTSMYGNADHYYPNASAAGLTSYSNGNSNSPQIGDILCFSGGGYGHVAIIRNVGTNQVTVIQQNVSENTNDANYSYPMTVSNGIYTIDGSRLGSTYNCQGWLRKSSSTQLPNLIPQNVSLSSYSTTTGSTITVNWTMANTGLGSSTATQTGVRITASSTDHGTATDTKINVPVAAIPAGSSVAQSASITVPSTAGTYYVWIVADNVPSGSAMTQTNYNDDYLCSQALTVISSSINNVILGIDVSGFQHDHGPITWSDVYNAGIRFVFVKTTESYDIHNNYSDSDIINAKSAKLMVGVYHLIRPDFPLNPNNYNKSASAEAKFFFSKAGNYMGNEYMPPVIDIDDLYGLDPSLVSQYARTFIDSIFSLSMNKIHNIVIYSTRSIFLQLDTALINNYPLWISTNDGDTYDVPCYKGSCWPKWKFKQYRYGDDGGTCPGITGSVDLDSFNGDINTFTSFINNATPINYISTDNFKFINYSNPFGSNTIIAYQLPIPTLVTITIFDELGRVIQTLMNGNEDAGYYTINFDASSLPGGLYFCRIEAGSYNKTIKLIHIK
jgi:GH25 family lysozyme M1 (1,4-beta-N-acetylmuramidase)